MDTRKQKKPEVSSDEWYTPRWVLDSLGEFDLDPCSPEKRPFDTARVHVTRQEDGLKYDWGNSRVWLNPPYSRDLLEQFVRKMSVHNNGIALLVNRQDNVLWQEVIFPTAASMLFLRNRVKFIHPEGKKSQPFTGSCLVAWGRRNDEVLRNCGIEGKYVVLNDCNRRLSYTDYTEEKERLEAERSLAIAKYDARLKRLRSSYVESNKLLLPGTRVRVTCLQRYKNVEVKEGIILGYWCATETSPLCYEVKFPINTRRVFEVESNDYKIEEVRE